MKISKPSLPNLAGLISGLICFAGIGLLAHRSFGDHRILADTASHIASARGFDIVTVSLMMGAFIALIISFVVTHVLEYFYQKQGE